MQLFISYARVDKYRVEEIVQILREGGHNPWFDIQLLPGQDWKAVLLRQVQSCETFIYMLTPDSVTSEWCQWEFGEAVTAHRPIIPILLHKKTKLPESIIRFQYADFLEGPTPQAVAKLMGGLTSLAVSIPPHVVSEFPISPNGVPAQVAWERQTQTISQQVLKKSSSLPRFERVAAAASNSGRGIGVDFGTTNSLCAIVEGGESVLIPNKFGHTSTPSAVAVGLDGSILVGEPALKFSLQYPERSVLEVKRLLGSSLALEVDGHSYEPETLASYVFEALKQDAEEYLREEVQDILLTAPAYFNNQQHKALREAVQLAGLKISRVIPEPTAACLAYHELYTPGISYGTAVYDLGGGTFDISIVVIGDGVADVRAINGDTQLGGLDYDRILVEYSMIEFEKQTEIDLRGNLSAQMRIREAAEKAKIVLSTATHTTIDVPYIYGNQRGAYNLSIPLSRTKFDELTYHLTERTIECCKNAIYDAKVEIDRLILVGLATRTPSIRETVSKFFGVQPVRGIDSDQVVVLGAALQAGVLHGDVANTLLLDVTAFTLAVDSLSGVAEPIIERNTTIPTKNSLIFTTTTDNQTHMLIQVVEGEHVMSADNQPLAAFIFNGISPAPKGHPEIEITLDIDANGIIIVITRDKFNKRERIVEIDKRSPTLFERLPSGVTGEVVLKSRLTGDYKDASSTQV